MKFLFLLVVALSLFADNKSLPVGQDGRKEELLIQCLVEFLTKVVSKSDTTPLQPQCKEILKKQGSNHALLMKKDEEDVLPPEEDEKRPEGESNARAQEIINELLKTKEEKREDTDGERSQEEFPNYYTRRHLLTSKEKREDPDDERSQEEFPQKRNYLPSTKEKREDEDEERSQEEFPTYEQKRHYLLTSKGKREDPDYDRSQEDFPSYVHKRYHADDEEREKQIWKPSHRYHNKRHDDSSNEDFAELNSQKKRSEESVEEEEEETAKRYWKPVQRYHYKKHHKRDGDSSDEDKESEEKEKRVLWPTHQYHHQKQQQYGGESSEEDSEEHPTEKRHEGSEESEDREKRIWKPTHRYHQEGTTKKHYHKQGDSVEFENENDANQEEKRYHLYHSLETSKRHSPEEDEEDLIARELNENNHYTSQEEQKRHPSDAEEEKQEKEAALRYLTKKRNELEERLLKEGEVYEKRNPWIFRGYYHPAWYKRSEENKSFAALNPSQKLEELANALRYKMGLLSQKESTEGEKAYLRQRALTPEELKELEKLASVEQRTHIN